MDLERNLSKKDAIKLLEIATNSTKCKGTADLKRLVMSAAELFDFQNSSATTISINDAKVMNPRIEFVDISLPDGYIGHYFESKFYLIDKATQIFLKTLKIHSYKDANRIYDDKIVYEDGCEWGMTDGFIFGLPDLNFKTISFFAFAGRYIENKKRTKNIIQYIVPHFIESLKKVVGENKIQRLSSSSKLTKREIEVLNWIKEGKSSWEISVILGVSERTTNFHIENIKKKLNASNRSQAAAIGLQCGIISF